MSGLSSQQEKQVPGTGRGPWGIWSSAHLAQPKLLLPPAGFVINKRTKNLMLAALGPGGTGPLPLPLLGARARGLLLDGC